MKSRKLHAAVWPLVLMCGCSSMNHTEKGAVVGGALGTGVGAIAGAACRNPLAGAAIGAGAGALGGALVGNSVDKQEAKAKDQVIAAAHAQEQKQNLGITDVGSMAQQHISDEVIIQQIRTAGTSYHLSASDIQYLKGNGVSDAVVMEMQATANRAPRRVYSAQPVYAPPPAVYVVEPAPPPPVIGVGFGYSHRGRCR